ncbi:MAG: hypothetical protein LBV73_03325 [Paraburkholderia sp.]|jgi:predicted aspartyl protease|nr:hypothetical protein [Paraburkholderia sp.]
MSTRPEFARLKPVIAGAVLCTLLAACTGKQDAQQPAAKASADAPVLSVPLQRNGSWVVEAQDAQNKTHRVLLDTGASLSMFEPEGPLTAAPLTKAAEAAFLRQGALASPTDDGNLTAGVFGQAHKMALGLGPALRIQQWSLPAGTLVFRAKFGRLASADDQPFDAVIGIEHMRDLIWRADYATGRLTAYANAAPAHDWQQCTFMTLATGTSIPLIEFSFESESNYFAMDTGFDSDVKLPQELFENLENAKRFPHVQTTFTTDITNRVVPNPQGLLAGLAIGQKTLPRLKVNGGSADPLFGMGLLEKMDRFELDFRHYRFCFDLPATPKDSTLTPSHSLLERSGEHYEVIGLLPDGALAHSGVKAGDQIAMVDQTSVAKLDLDQVYALLGSGNTRQVTVQRGERTLVIDLKPN